MPELPQMQALAERIEGWLLGETLVGYVPLGFSGLKTAVPSPDELIGRTLTSVGRRAKYVLLNFDGEPERRIVFHLSQAGRVDFEQPPKKTKPKGSVVRWRFSDEKSSDEKASDEKAILLREWGTERKAGWWVLGPGDDGPLATLGPEATSDEFAQWLRTSDDGRRVHTILRDQRTVAGVGRGYADDALHRAKLSPYASLKSLKPDERQRLLEAIAFVLEDGLQRERTRTGGLSANKLGEHFTVHGRAGLPCPVCGDDMKRVSYESHEVVYCPQCQTGGKVLADRRLSRLVK
jgi:formamidopyrimidine-DNA glycosylase